MLCVLYAGSLTEIEKLKRVLFSRTRCDESACLCIWLTSTYGPSKYLHRPASEHSVKFTFACFCHCDFFSFHFGCFFPFAITINTKSIKTHLISFERTWKNVFSDAIDINQ